MLRSCRSPVAAHRRSTAERAKSPACCASRLWSPIVAEWYEGKDDPKLALVRFDVEDAKIWLSDIEGFLRPAFNKLLGRKPEAGMKEKVAEVSL
jgi:Pyridoxamine 5'-phosphate oxidase like